MENIKLKGPTELSKMDNIELIGYIDKIHNHLLNCQLSLDQVKHIVRDNKYFDLSLKL